MPELPEVETIIQDLKAAGIIGRLIQQAHVFWPKTVATPAKSTFLHQIRHQKILNLTRRGKFLVFSLSDYDLLIHLRMTGRLLLVPEEASLNSYIRLSLDLDGGEKLLFHDTRKFGRWYLVKDSQAVLYKMGPEPLEASFPQEIFKERLQKHKRALKPLLLDQTFIAGLGNIYVDEALWEAYLHPLRQAKDLSSLEQKKLHQAIIKVLKRGIENQGTTLGTGRTNYYRLKGQKGKHQTLLNVFRRTHQPCSRCGALIERMKVAQRSTHFCPHCQVLK